MKFKNYLITALFLLILISGNTVFAANPIYRLYNEETGEHLYTPDENEYFTLSSNGWNDENIGWYAPDDGEPVYRLNNDELQNHLYTTDENEVNILTSQNGWTKDFDGKPMFYSGGDIPIYRLYNQDLRGMHHLTSDINEYDVLPEHGWKQEGICLYAVENKDGLESFGLLESNPNYLNINETKSVKFTFQSLPTATSVKLYDEKNTLVGSMNDEGINGDEVKGDSVYTILEEITLSQPKSLRYLAKADNGLESECRIDCFENPSQSDQEIIQNHQNTIQNIFKKYCDSEGYIKDGKIENCLDELEGVIKGLLESGTVISYERNDSLLRVTYSCGITIDYEPPVKDLLAGAGDGRQVYLIQANYEDLKKLNKNPMLEKNNPTSFKNGNMADMMDQADDLIEKTFSNYTFDKKLRGDGVTAENILDGFKPNKLLVWQGHGGYSKDDHSTLLTGKDFSWIKYTTDLDYQDDVKSKRILHSVDFREYTSLPYWKEIITYRYFRDKNINLSNSIILIDACESGADTVLAKTLLDKGAVAVIVNSKSITKSYAEAMFPTILYYLTQKKSETQNYYTLNQALNKAKKDFGDTDPGSGCEVYIVGNKNLRLGENKPSVPDTGVSGQRLMAFPTYISTADLPETYTVYYRPEGSSSNQELGSMTVSEKAFSPLFNEEVLTIPINNPKPGIYFFVNRDWSPYYDAMIGAIKVTESDISSGKDIVKDFWLTPDEYFSDEYGYDF